MKNLHEYNEFKNMKSKISESIQDEPLIDNELIEEEKMNEGAQLFDDDTWKVRTRIEIPQSLINSYVKKVKDETGENVRAKWSDQELAEEIANFITTSFMTIENLPTSMTTSVKTEPTIQAQEDMPVQAQVETEIDTEEPVQGQPQAQVQTQPQGQPQGQSQGQPAQTTAQTVPQKETPTAEI